VFLTNAAAGGRRAAYFRALVSAGAVIENHTLTHVRLTQVSAKVRTRQICGAAASDRADFGATPALLRPPYGDWNASVVTTARTCGMRALIGWDAVMPARGGLQTWGGGQRLHPGDIVLLHFTPGLTHQVSALLHLIARQHLRPALLEDYV
jgi:peptidoglycan/xylan/chitin deacetylase (PgdA/CDA1 family)